MLDHNTIIMLGGISYLLIPLLLKFKTLYKVIFMICGIAAIITIIFINDFNYITYFKLILMATPWVIAIIKKGKLQKENL